MKHSSNSLKRVLAIALAAILTLTPVFTGNVFAVGTETVDQIVSNGKTVTTADGNVRHSKTIVQTGENTFDITLKVQTKENIETQSASKDAAVVLVLDVSNSMTNNDIRDMKAAAIDFVEAFVENAGNGLRYVSVVLFGSDGNTLLGWTNANGKFSTVKSAISTISGNGGGTNMEAGLRLANNLLSSATVSSLPNKYVVLMTDGVPTYYVSDKNETSSTTSMKGTAGGGNYATDNDYHDITCNKTTGNGKRQHNAGDNLPQQIKNKGAKLYTVSYKGDNNTNHVDGKSIDAWLALFATQNITAKDDIFAGLGAVASVIVNQAQAWILTDPMGDYIEFDTNSGIVRVTNANTDSSDAVRKFNTDTNTLTWNLKSDATRVGPVDGWYTYTLTYSVRLDDTAEGFVSGHDYAANGITELTYMITENNVLVDKLYSTELIVPVVEGYLADLFFVKVDENSGEPLANAKFTLTHVCCGDEIADVTVSSAEDGSVSIHGIPSGHSYVLSETEAPEGYYFSDEIWNITVSYGTLFVNGEQAADLVFENAPIPPATTETEPPVTTETEPPVTTETEPPVTTETEPPVTTETEPPVTTETEPPVTTETEPPVTTETEPPVTTETEPPVTTETEPPVTTETEPPVTTEEEPEETRKPIIVIIRPHTTTTPATTEESSVEPPPVETEVTEPAPAETEITEPTVPTETEPPMTTETEEEIEIEDPSVPLDDGNDIPHTGDESAGYMIALTAVMLLSAIGMAVLLIGGRKASRK